MVNTMHFFAQVFGWESVCQWCGHLSCYWQNMIAKDALFRSKVSVLFRTMLGQVSLDLIDIFAVLQMAKLQLDIRH